VLAYPHIPGSHSDAFKGVSVFLGLMVSQGSAGLVNQIMSGLTVIYSHAYHRGDFIRIGEQEGRVQIVGLPRAARRHALAPARRDPGRLQRAWRADHVSALRGAAGGARHRSALGLVHRAGLGRGTSELNSWPAAADHPPS
jgi:hypothetical protein